ncbi:superoxide dismutase [Jannaschia pagri]|uniref:Superoxide dismutase n=1 Tax=Jannaschia pagri TaxID=2829797 RepID=A0ABQ4NPI2_9RHOB|nr:MULTISPECIES: superoxide dismutase family protein [unclassified Jannaschia]GIT92474.1 superoxide dismutase [Jannaschia sp. AI_61]GIT96309.1 superoxide dismutase [Jannaschia sp. AI_62]
MRRFALALALAMTAPSALLAQETGTTPSPTSLAGDIVAATGDQLGSVSVTELANGVVHLIIQATDIPPGPHGMRLHEVGTCEGDFSSAEGPITGSGADDLGAENLHAGDLPNAYVEDDGVLSMEAFALPDLTMAMLTDDDGAALIIHADRRDFGLTSPDDAGARLACAVLDAIPAAEEN